MSEYNYCTGAGCRWRDNCKRFTDELSEFPRFFESSPWNRISNAPFEERYNYFQNVPKEAIKPLPEEYRAIPQLLEDLGALYDRETGNYYDIFDIEYIEGEWSDDDGEEEWLEPYWNVSFRSGVRYKNGFCFFFIPSKPE